MSERTGPGPADLDSTDVATGGRSVTPADLIRVPLRRWRLPLAGLLIGLLAGLAYLALPAKYEAAALVTIRPIVTDPFSYPGPGSDRVVNMTVEDGLATGTAVISAVAKATGESTTDAAAGLTVELPTGTQVLRFGFTAKKGPTAIAGANAAATTYLQVREAAYKAQRDALVAQYDASIKTLSAQVAAIRKTVPSTSPAPNLSSPPSTTASLDSLRTLDDEISQLNAKRIDAAAIDVTPGSVVHTATPPATSNRRSAVLYAFAAVLGGLLLGAVVAFGAEAIDRRVRSAADAASVSGLPVLAELRGRGLLRRDGGRAAADLRYLALAVLGQLGPIPHRGIVLLSTRSRDAVDAMGVSLAVAFAEQGNTVRWKDLTADTAGAVTKLRLAGTTAAPAPGPPAASTDIPVIPGKKDEDPDKTETIPRMTPVLLDQRAKAAEAETGVVRVGSGQIWLAAPAEAADTMITVLRAGPADRDEEGVRAALENAAVIVVRRDRTKNSDLERLTGRLKLTGVRCLGVVLVSGNA